MAYTGIGPDALLLLSRNKFEDSKEFYEAHKAQIKDLVLTPMAEIARALAGDFRALDSGILLEPTRITSRIRRDTRFTKEKHLYRDNVWMCFMRPKAEHPVLQPLLWFEVQPGEHHWSAGIAVWDQTPAYLRYLRERISSAPEEFLAAADCAIEAGGLLQAEAYKKDRAPDAPEHLKPYFNAKNFCFMRKSEDMALLESEAIIDELRDLYAGLRPMYRWLLAAMEDFRMRNA